MEIHAHMPSDVRCPGGPLRPGEDVIENSPHVVQIPESDRLVQPMMVRAMSGTLVQMPSTPRSIS